MVENKKNIDFHWNSCNKTHARICNKVNFTGKYDKTTSYFIKYNTAVAFSAGLKSVLKCCLLLQFPF